MTEAMGHGVNQRKAIQMTPERSTRSWPSAGT
jgi:hypothetical protein